ncbi:MAG: hypothetical protein ACI9C4_002481, partial [Paraglaciecola sp.]
TSHRDDLRNKFALKPTVTAIAVTPVIYLKRKDSKLLCVFSYS